MKFATAAVLLAACTAVSAVAIGPEGLKPITIWSGPNRTGSKQVVEMGRYQEGQCVTFDFAAISIDIGTNSECDFSWYSECQDSRAPDLKLTSGKPYIADVTSLKDVWVNGARASYCVQHQIIR